MRTVVYQHVLRLAGDMPSKLNDASNSIPMVSLSVFIRKLIDYASHISSAGLDPESSILYHLCCHTVRKLNLHVMRLSYSHINMDGRCRHTV